MKKLFALFAAIAATFLSASQSFAAMLPADLTLNGFDLSEVETLVGLVITGLVVMWGARKIIKTINRS